MDKSLFFQRKPSSPPPTDLECLSGWAARLKLHLQKDQPSRHSPAIFRPCRMTSPALMRLSITFPYIVERINASLENTKRRFESYMEDGGELVEEDFCDAMFSLMGRIEDAVKTIAAETEKPDPGSWSFPATLKTWAKRFDVSERTIFNWRNDRGFRIKQGGKPSEWQVHTEESAYIAWNSTRTSFE